MNYSFRKILLVTLLAILAIFVLLFLIHYFTFGQLQISSNDASAEITVKTAANNQPSGLGTVAHGKGHLIVSLKAGEYYVYLLGPQSLSSKSTLVTVKARSSTKVNLNLAKVSSVEPVLYDNAQGLAVDSNRLIYLNSTDSLIYLIDDQNNRTALSNTKFRSVEWLNTGYGVAQDYSNSLYIINGSILSKVNLPVSVSSADSISYTMAPDKTIYVALGSTVYKIKDNVSSVLYNKWSSGSSLVAMQNGVSIITPGYGGSANSSITIINSGHQLTKSFNGLINAWSNWSPSGQKIAILNGSLLEILNSSLNQLATVPQTNTTNLTWLNDDVLMFNVEGQLWSYSLSSEQSQLVANMTYGAAVQSIAISGDKSYIYVTTNDSLNGTTIKRIGIVGQSVPQYIFQLQSALLTPQQNYSLEVINFNDSAPLVIVDVNPGTNPTDDLQLAKNQLQSDRINISSLRFQVSGNGL